MRTTRKVLGWVLSVVVFVSVFTILMPTEGMSAAGELGTPKITLKRINEGTGVKITVGKTKGAEGYDIYISNTDNAYSKYMYNDGKYDHYYGYIEKDGTKKRTYTIKGLPKGKYTFKVRAYNAEWEYSDFSEEKTVKIKAGKTVEKAEKTYDFSKAEVGDVIEFGSYEQDDNMINGKEAIEWIVLSKDKNQMLVVSKYALDTLPYNKEDAEITWETCTLREWLNKSFYKTAFSKKERKMIKQTTLTNKDNAEYGTFGGNNTKDRVFLLSLDDMTNIEYGFNSGYNENDIARRCAPTAYAVAQGTGMNSTSESDRMTSDGENTCWWLLRSPGISADYVTDVIDNGHVNTIGRDACNDFLGVRPALYISLNS